MDVMAALTFCRWAIGLTFAVSAGGKAASVAAFRETLRDLGLRRRRNAIAIATISAEALATAGVAAGGLLAAAGFALALALLAAFSAVLARALSRREKVSCNCFGTSERPISPYDLGRNATLGLAAGAGEWAALASSRPYPPAALIAVLGLMAAGLLLLATNLQDITELLRRPHRYE